MGDSNKISLVKKICIVISALLQGHTVKLDGREYIYDDGLCVLGNKITYEHAIQVVPLRVDIDLAGFINMVSKLTDDEIIVIGANVVLTDLHRSPTR